MKPNRIIKNGKLDIYTELIGGSSDGMLCDYDADIIRIPKADKLPLLLSDESIIEMPHFQYDEYVRISTEKAILR